MLIELVQILILLLPILCTLYLLFFAIASKIPSKRKNPLESKLNRFVVLIPAYKENIIIRSVAKSAIEHNYPKELFDVIVIADTLQSDTVEYIRSTGCKVLEVSFESSTKAKSLNAALEQLTSDMFDYAVVLDVDNIMHKDFLLLMNDSINLGYKVVQGHRTAKNTNTTTALLDAISEEVNNSIFRKGHRRLGLSAMIIGSAFAIELNVFKRLMYDIRDVAGEDRELDIKLLSERIKIDYNDKAIVFDEKVESWDNFTRQRTRWAAAHLDFILKYFSASFSLLMHGNIDYFNKVWHTLIPPRVTLLVLDLLVILVFAIIGNHNYLILATINLLLYAFTLGISIPRFLYTKKLINAILSIPFMFTRMVIAWTRIKGQKDKFLATEHTYDGDDDENRN